MQAHDPLWRRLGLANNPRELAIRQILAGAADLIRLGMERDDHHACRLGQRIILLVRSGENVE